MRQGQNDLPRHAGVFAGFRSFDRVPQCNAVAGGFRGLWWCEDERSHNTLAVVVAVRKTPPFIVQHRPGAVRGGGHGGVAVSTGKHSQ
jgi:hypothetical protein